MKLFFVVIVLLVPAWGRDFSFGIKAGGLAGGAAGGDGYLYSASEARPYIFGPAVEFRLPFRLAAEGDALYSRTGYRSGYCRFTYCASGAARANVFAFPMLVRYRFLLKPVGVFAAGGLCYRHVGVAHGNAWSWRTGPIVANEVVDYTVQQRRFSDPSRNGLGAVGGGGLEFKVGRVRLSPEFRYTRWKHPAWSLMGSGDGFYFNGSSLNQFDALFGVVF